MDLIKFEYKGFEIRYFEDENKWVVCSSFSLVGKYESLIKAKEAVNRRVKEASKIEPFSAFISARHKSDGKFQVVKITSINAKGEAWATGINGNGERFKIDETIYKYTPENETRIVKIHALNKEIQKLEVERYELQSGLQEIDVSALLNKNNKEDNNVTKTN